MVKIVRNVGGVIGLDVALDAFSEDIERRLFESGTLFVHSPAQGATQFGKERNGRVSGPQTWDPDVWKTLNLVGDLFPEHYVPPDYCLSLSYPNGAQFKDHFDSRYRWGECIVGICLGQAGVMYYVQQKGPAPEEWEPVEGLDVKVSTQKSGKVCVEVTLPRRTIYRMNGPARLDWKHGIRMQTEARLKSFPPPPAWNRPWNMRRSLTLRCHKAYSDAYLQHQLELHPNDAHLQARWKQQKPFRPQNDYGGNRLNNAELALEQQRCQGILQRMLNSPYRDLRWGDDDTYQSFAGSTGNRLGGEGLSQMIASVAGAQEDVDLQAAIRASLGQQQEQQSASPSSFTGGGNRLGGDSNTEEESELQAALRLSLGESSQQAMSPFSNGGTSGDPISLDDNDENAADSTKSLSNGGGKRQASDEKEESEESKRKRLRLARLRRFEISETTDI